MPRAKCWGPLIGKIWKDIYSVAINCGLMRQRIWFKRRESVEGYLNIWKVERERWDMNWNVDWGRFKGGGLAMALKNMRERENVLERG